MPRIFTDFVPPRASSGRTCRATPPPSLVSIGRGRATGKTDICYTSHTNGGIQSGMSSDQTQRGHISQASHRGLKVVPRNVEDLLAKPEI
jgi:hypothetical protein